MQNSSIEWCDHTFNPWHGCIEVSPGCTQCYARVLNHRYGFDNWGPSKTTPRRMMSEGYWKQPVKWNAQAAANGTRPRVFCASMADWLEDHPMLIEPRARLIQLIHDTPHLDWLLLTKRPEGWGDRLHEVVRQTHDGADVLASRWLDGDAPPNVWAGASAENQEWANKRTAHLRDIPAQVLFLSMEPLLGPIDLEQAEIIEAAGPAWAGYNANIDWIIIGGESGHGARPMEVDWARSLIEQCRNARVPVFMKQMGAVWARDTQVAGKPVAAWGDVKGHDMQHWPADLRVREFPAVQQKANEHA